MEFSELLKQRQSVRQYQRRLVARELLDRRLLRIPRGRRIGLLATLGYAAEGYPLRGKARKSPDLMSRFDAY